MPGSRAASARSAPAPSTTCREGAPPIERKAWTNFWRSLEPLRLGLVGKDAHPHLTPLTGGVSSDIWLVETEGRRFCVKRALARLKVAALWEAPVARNAAEAAWMRAVAGWAPQAVPKLLGEDAGSGLFAMAYLPPEDHPLWKAELLAGRVDDAFAAAVGAALAMAIHARSAADPSIPRGLCQ